MHPADGGIEQAFSFLLQEMLKYQHVLHANPHMRLAQLEAERALAEEAEQARAMLLHGAVSDRNHHHQIAQGLATSNGAQSSRLSGTQSGRNGPNAEGGTMTHRGGGGGGVDQAKLGLASSRRVARASIAAAAHNLPAGIAALRAAQNAPKKPAPAASAPHRARFDDGEEEEEKTDDDEDDSSSPSDPAAASRAASIASAATAARAKRAATAAAVVAEEKSDNDDDDDDEDDDEEDDDDDEEED
jgi:hypothetical protein